MADTQLNIERLAVCEAALLQLRKDFEKSAESQGKRIGKLEPKRITNVVMITIGLAIGGSAFKAWFAVQERLDAKASIKSVETLRIEVEDTKKAINEVLRSIDGLSVKLDSITAPLQPLPKKRRRD